ncbi:hypothetical protein [Brachybacterium alimentarium]|uniref:hypothetical protein n=1 Tax=Brachybacterium alimentarium TaxID=47845 RepID=UPI001FE52D55|nr:hypothetical protein [Brachybacterium alimentarium]
MAAGTIGMPVPRSMWSASSEQFHTLVLRGVEETAVAEGYSVLSAVVDTLEAEIALIRRWAHQRLVDVVILKDLRRDDPRPRLLRELRMPFVLVGDVRQTGAEAAVLTDNSRSMHVLLEELLALGHHRIRTWAGRESCSIRSGASGHMSTSWPTMRWHRRTSRGTTGRPAGSGACVPCSPSRRCPP